MRHRGEVKRTKKRWGITRMYIQYKKMIGAFILLLLTFFAIGVSSITISLDIFCVFILINVLLVIIIVFDKQQPFNLFTE